MKRHHKESNSDYYSLVEVYYTKDGRPALFADHDEAVGETPEEIRSHLIFMLADADTEIDKKRYIDEKDFQEGGRYYENGQDWSKELGVDKIIESAQKDDKRNPPADARMELHHWFAQFEVENREDYRKSIQHFVSLLKEKGVSVDIPDLKIEEMAEESYKTWRGDDEEN